MRPRHTCLRTPCRIGRSRSSLRRLQADRDQRRIGGGHFDAARGLPLVEERRRVVRRAAIGADQNFIAAARGRTFSAQAVVAHDPYAGTRRPLLALRPWRTGRTNRTRWTGDARIPFGPCRPGWPGSPLGPWPHPPSPNVARTSMNSAKEVSRRLCTFSLPYLGAATPAPHIKYPHRIQNSVARSKPDGRPLSLVR